ncbi:MAG: ABC transporter ATP-binding protein [Acidobacteria bacterium]|nr:ABC transporter ATP-binding protein [Acidobacteriota bacterium]
MLKAEKLTKIYGNSRGVEEITFNVEKGEIVGFLGPNGAGKTTTMRLITGFLYPNRGDALIEGFSIIENPEKAREFIGYLPENNPLYEDLKVNEYLDFRGRLKGLKGQELKKRIDEVAQKCEITDVMGKLIGSCSKGYKQRIGIADALINDPPLLILDEPTQGLDPAQIYHTRELIKSLSEGHTVILSTHILSEVEAICSKALLIHKGKILFDGSLEEMKSALRGAMQIKITFLCPQYKGAEILAQIPNVEKFFAEKSDDEKKSSFIVEAKEGADLREEIFWKCYDLKIPILEIFSLKRSLEDAFLKMISDDEETLQ